MRIKKVINNNILCVIDEKGHESIVTGRGLGFGRKVGQFVDSGGVEKIYRMEDKTGQRRLRELVEQIPLEHLHLTEQMIETIRSEIRQPLNESLLITLADHISFAIQRKAQGELSSRTPWPAASSAITPPSTIWARNAWTWSAPSVGWSSTPTRPPSSPSTSSTLSSTPI